MNKRLHHGIQNLVFRIASWILPVILTWTMAIPALAANTAEAPSGTLTIRPKYGDEILTASQYDGTFKVYHIADEGATGSYTKDDSLAGLDVTITSDALSDDESYKELTQTIAAYVREHSDAIDPRNTGVKVDETLSLDYGLYLIMSDVLATGYQDFESFLVLIPEYGENTTNTNVIAYPKVSPEPDSPDSPDTPDTPDRPRRSRSSNTPTAPATPNIDEIGSIEEAGTEGESGPASIEEAGAFTGDSSQMLLYGAVAAAAAVALVVWVLHRRKAH